MIRLVVAVAGDQNKASAIRQVLLLSPDGSPLAQKGRRLKRTIKPKDHAPVQVTTPYGSSTTPADMLRHIRAVEARAQGAAFHKAQREKKRTA